MKNLVTAFSVMATLGVGAANAQSTAAVNFLEGENNGAAMLARSFYGAAGEEVRTSIIDIDNNGVAEIAVRFPDRCLRDDQCLTTILYHDGDEWLEIYSENVRHIQLRAPTHEAEAMSVVSSSGIEWYWFGNQYRPSVFNETTPGNPSRNVPSMYFNEDISAEGSMMWRHDINGDGDLETIVTTSDFSSCLGFGDYCPVYVYDSDDRLAGIFYSMESSVSFRNIPGGGKEIIAVSREGIEFYAFDGQSINMVSSVGHMPVRTAY